jgi:hypothetical protein
MAMKLEKENVRIIFNKLLYETDLWGREGKEAEKILCYISGLQDMANEVIKAIEDLGGK